MLRFVVASWLLLSLACATPALSSVPRNGIPPTTTWDGKLDPDEVYACTITNGQFQCVPYAVVEAAKAAQAAKAFHGETL